MTKLAENQRFKEELQDIARSIEDAAKSMPTYEQEQSLRKVAKRAREAGSLIVYADRVEDAKQFALEAYSDFTALVDEGVFRGVQG